MISNYVSPTNVMMNIPDLMLDISSFCDYKELGVLQCVSTKWYIIAGDDRLWQDLFACYFPRTLSPKNRCKEAFKSRLTPICSKSHVGVNKVIMTFVCQLKLDTKRQLVCEFPSSKLFHYSYFFTIQQGFGPKRGTEEGFEGAAEEIEYLEYIGGNNLQHKKGEEFFSQQFIQCPTSQNEGIPLCISSYGVSPRQQWEGGNSFISGYDDEKLIDNKGPLGSLDDLLYCCANECVKMDVGWGNTLGYFSEINDWKSPFKLHCIMREAGQPVWTGLFPKNYRFKFVLIDAKGGITWERAEGNRHFGHYSSLKTHCKHTPIEF
jgi:F-box domain